MTTKRFYFQDSLGNTTHLSDEAGNVLERYTYSAFGTPSFYNSAGNQIIVSGKNVSALGIRHLFQGQLWTQETGLDDYRNRVEHPIMGVFLQPDPIGFKGDAANLYRFCTNNAVNRIDPLGLVDTNATRLYGHLTHHGGSDTGRANQPSDQPAGVIIIILELKPAGDTRVQGVGARKAKRWLLESDWAIYRRRVLYGCARL